MIEIKVGQKNAKSIAKKYNLNTELKPGDYVEIPVELLSNGSHYKVDVECDYCGKLLKNVVYKAYVKSTSVINKYSCSNKECSNQKIKDVCQEKYGVDNPFQDQEVKDKIKNTFKEKYGVDHQMHLKEVKDKIKNTNLEKYGVDSYTKTDEYKEKSKKTNLEKYGEEYYTKTDEYKERVNKTNLERYGVKWTQMAEEVKKKTRETNLEKRGVECNFQCEINKEKIRQTNLKKYGVDNPFKADFIKEKIEKTNLEKWGTYRVTKGEIFRKENYNISQNVNHIKYIGDKISLFKCDKGFNHQFEISSGNYLQRNKSNLPLCTVCNPIGGSVSIKEKEVFEFIDSIYSGKIIQSYRDVLEIDIYLPELKLGFEFNGLYWHSEKYKDKWYHINKSNYFKDKGIRVIHIWEDDWDFKNKIIKSQIRNWLGLNSEKIFARKCEFKELKDIKIIKKFLNDNHVQGWVRSSLKLGLYHNGELVSVMVFDHNEGRDKMYSDEWNLSRFCNKLGTNVVGGASKLLKNFIKNYDVKRIISYADKDWSGGHLYEKLGFELIKDNNPDYKYIVDNKRVHKSRFKKANLNTELSEANFMKKQDIPKIWDCGKLKYEMVINKKEDL